MGRKVSVNVALAITLLAMTVTFAITWLVASANFSTQVNALTEKQAQFDKLAEIDKYVRGNYYGDIEENYLNDRLGRGYLDGIGDRYAVYYSAAEYTEKLALESGELVGVGLEVAKDTIGYRIIKVYAESPAAKAGVTEGGYILSVDGTDTKSVASVANLRTLLRGAQGTTLEMTCLYGASDEQNFSFQRMNYTAPTVESQRVDNYEYVRIFGFGPNTYVEFEYLVRTAVNEGVKGFVFDVRDNAGGQFRYGYDAIDMLCPLGTIARQENKGGVTKVLATSDEDAVALPMVVLVNANTAGVAELFATSVRDMAGGQIIGVKTQGRGTIQSDPFQLSDGSAISVTIARLLVGDGTETFDVVGLEPDIEVLAGTEEGLNLFAPDPATDMQIARALEAVRTMARAAGLETETPPVDSSPASSSSSRPESVSIAESESDSGSEEEEETSGSSSASSSGSSAASSASSPASSSGASASSSR